MSDVDTREIGGGAGLQKFCAQVWWLVLLRGICLLILGFLLVTRPALTAVVLMQFIGAYFLVDGLFTIIHAFQGTRHRSNWGWGVLMGVLEMLTGLIIFAQPFISTVIAADMLVFIVAFMAFLFGFVGLVTWWQVRHDLNGGWGMLAGSLLALFAGVILLIYPEQSAKTYLILMGVGAILGGIVQIFASFMVRKLGKEGLAALQD